MGFFVSIPKLLGAPISDAPVAEMWLGAHPADPSRLHDGRTLEQAIQEDPVRMLGDRVHESFGPRLPFLMKLLAAREPLSLQVHPTSERARIRFAEQNAAGIPMDAPHRSYQDASHKPELIYALTRFEGMAGFRNNDQDRRDPSSAAAAMAGRFCREVWGNSHAVPDTPRGDQRDASHERRGAGRPTPAAQGRSRESRAGVAQTAGTAPTAVLGPQRRRA